MLQIHRDLMLQDMGKYLSSNLVPAVHCSLLMVNCYLWSVDNILNLYFSSNNNLITLSFNNSKFI